MGRRFMGVDIAGLVNQHLGRRLDTATLTHYTPGEVDDDDPTAGAQDLQSTHEARGFFDEYQDRHVDGVRIQRGDRMVVLIGDSISPAVKPAPGDTITLLGETARIVEGGVRSDPAGATYTCQVRAF